MWQIDVCVIALNNVCYGFIFSQLQLFTIKLKNQIILLAVKDLRSCKGPHVTLSYICNVDGGYNINISLLEIIKQ